MPGATPLLQPFPASIDSMDHLSYEAAAKYNVCRVNMAHVDAQLYALKEQTSILGRHINMLINETRLYAASGISHIEVGSHNIGIADLFDALSLSRECLKKIFDQKNLARSDLRLCLNIQNRTMQANQPQLPELSYEEKGDLSLQIEKKVRSKIVANFQKTYDAFQKIEPSAPPIFEFTKGISEILGKPFPEVSDFSHIDSWIGNPDSIDPRV